MYLVKRNKLKDFTKTQMKRTIFPFLFFCFYFSSIQAQAVDTLTVMVYNLLNFPNGRDDCGTNTVVPARWDTLAKLIDYVQPDVLMICELQNEIGADLILDNALNVNGRSGYLRANFVPNRSVPSSSDLNNMLFYNSTKLGMKQQGEVLTDLRDVGVYTLYGKDTSLDIHNDTTWLDFMVTHLKGSSGISNESRRALACDSIRKYIDTASSARNVILGGDFNLYASTEEGFQTLLGGAYSLNDPIEVTGRWNNSFAHAGYHTQSTRLSNSLDCGALGGMDSRFDFLMVSNPVLFGTKRVAYIYNSYTTLGNNGSTYNDSINGVANTSAVPSSITNALHSMSDHLPIILKLKITYPNITLLYNQLESFVGKATWLGNDLSWVMREPHLVDKLELEYSADAILFDKLVEFRDVSSYKHEMVRAKDCYYRLKWESSGQVFYSNTIFISNKMQAPTIKVYPNPAHYTFYINILDDLSYSNTEITLYNALGKRCFQSTHNFSKNPQSRIYLNSLEHGVYTIRMKNEYFSSNQRIVIK